MKSVCLARTVEVLCHRSFEYTLKTVENHFKFENVYWVYKYCAMLFEKLESFLMSPGFCLLLLESAVSKLWLHYRTFITRILFEFSRGVIGTVATPPVTKAPYHYHPIYSNELNWTALLFSLVKLWIIIIQRRGRIDKCLRSKLPIHGASVLS